MNPKKISPSLLSANFANLERDIKVVEKGGAHLLHVDVMDGHFVPNITIGPPVVEAIKKTASIPLDVHLMIENPGQYVDDFCTVGADYLTIHVEATPHLNKVIHQIKDRGVKAGVSLNPHTPIVMIEEVLQDLDMVLIMSVNPGFGGQSFIPQSLDKIRKLRGILHERGLDHVEIEIDGGVKMDNIKKVVEAGVDIVVSGSGIFKTNDPAAMVRKMREVIGP
jgi:ribulose-phosphate 3-epimerase